MSRSCAAHPLPSLSVSVSSRRIAANMRVWLFLLLLMLYVFHVNDFVSDPMAIASMTLTMSIVDHGTVVIDDYAHGLIELAYRDGRFYSGMPPGQSFLALPIYAVLRPALVPAARALHPVMNRLPPARGRFDQPYMVRRVLLLLVFQLLIAIPAAAVAPVMVYDLARRHDSTRRCALSLALLLGVGTLWWSYGGGAGHRLIPATLLLLPLWWLVCRRDAIAPRRAAWEAAAIGAGVGMALSIRYDPALVAVPVSLYFLARTGRANALRFAIGAVLMLSVTGLYHYRCFGSPLTTPYDVKLSGLPLVIHEYHDSIEGLERVTFDGVDWAVYSQNRRWFNLDNLGEALVVNPQAMWRFTPPLALALVGLWVLRRDGVGRGYSLAVAGGVVAGLVILVLMPHPGFRGAVGPRYLLSSLPYWVLLLGPVWGRLPTVVRGVLAAASFGPCYLAAMFTTRLDAAWDFTLLGRFGLSNYLFSRAHEIGMGVAPVVSTAICLVFWLALAMLARRTMLRGE